MTHELWILSPGEMNTGGKMPLSQWGLQDADATIVYCLTFGIINMLIRHEVCSFYTSTFSPPDLWIVSLGFEFLNSLAHRSNVIALSPNPHKLPLWIIHVGHHFRNNWLMLWADQFSKFFAILIDFLQMRVELYLRKLLFLYIFFKMGCDLSAI